MPEKIFDINDRDNDVKNSNSPLLWYFSDTTSSVYKKQFKVKSNNNENMYIDKDSDKCTFSSL